MIRWQRQPLVVVVVVVFMGTSFEVSVRSAWAQLLAAALRVDVHRKAGIASG
jgi:hypothetical protein